MVRRHPDPRRRPRGNRRRGTGGARHGHLRGGGPPAAGPPLPGGAGESRRSHDHRAQQPDARQGGGRRAGPRGRDPRRAAPDARAGGALRGRGARGPVRRLHRLRRPSIHRGAPSHPLGHLPGRLRHRLRRPRPGPDLRRGGGRDGVRRRDRRGLHRQLPTVRRGHQRVVLADPLGGRLCHPLLHRSLDPDERGLLPLDSHGHAPGIAPQPEPAGRLWRQGGGGLGRRRGDPRGTLQGRPRPRWRRAPSSTCSP